MATSTPSKYYSDKHTKKEKVDMSCDQCSTTAEQILNDIDSVYINESCIKAHCNTHYIFCPQPYVVKMLLDAGAIPLESGEGNVSQPYLIPKTWEVNSPELLRRIFCVPRNTTGKHHEPRFVVPREVRGGTLYCLYNIRRVGYGKINDAPSVETGMASMRQSVRDCQDWEELSPLIRDLFPDCECGK